MTILFTLHLYFAVGLFLNKKTRIIDVLGVIVFLGIECILLKFHWGMHALIELHFQHEALH
jgi:hypothetical protein